MVPPSRHRRGRIAGHVGGSVVGARQAHDRRRRGDRSPTPDEQWAYNYSPAKIVYSGVGSGAGLTQITNGTVNFGASDKPLTRAVLNASPALVQFPSCVEGIVPIVHISGVKAGQLKLTGAVLAKIYEGKITTWSNSAITALNPTIKSKLKGNIVTVHRSDSSGTTWIFTHYLKAVTLSWPFADMTGPWPVGIGEKGSAGVANEVQSKAGAIGYVEYSYALTAHIPYAQMKNRLRQVGAALDEHVRSRRHARQVHVVERLRHEPRQHEGRQGLADHGRDLHPGPSRPEELRHRQRHAQVLQLGAHQQQGHRGRQGSQLRAPADGCGHGDQEVWHADVKAGSKPCW